MGSSKRVNGKRSTVAVVVTCTALAFAAAPAHAGILNPLAGPAEAGSAMYTIGDLHQRLTDGTAGTKRAGAFVEPTDLGATMNTLDDVMALAPALDTANGAAVVDVCSGKTFWGLRSGAGWGKVTGTGACTPIFLLPAGPFSVAENAAAATPVGIVAATGTGIVYSITAGNTGNVFTIDSSGQITRSASGTIDYETARSYALTVRATIGAATRDVSVTVNVTDVDDTAPVFLASGPFSVAENSAVDTPVGKVVATDVDSTTLTYSIDAAGNTGNAFKIDSSGQIAVRTAVLDFESAPSYSLTVRASDSVNEATRTVTITVVDVNDPPTVAVNAGLIMVGTDVDAIITSAMLRIDDVDSTAPQRTIVITQLPSRGSLQFNTSGSTWVNLAADCSFVTQTDINSSDFRYHFTGSTGTDSFKFTVSDSEGGTVAETTFSITVN